MEANQLVKEIDNIIKNDYQFENEEFENCIFKKLKDNNEETNRKGFMIFAERVDNFEMDADYPYKRRYYYVEKLNDNENGKKIIFVLFNCSTSNPNKLDPTVENCKSLAEKEEYSQIDVLNLFSIRNSEVKKIKKEDLTGDDFNFEFIKALLNTRKEDKTNTFDVVLAWGYGKESKDKQNLSEDTIKGYIYNRISNFREYLNDQKLNNIKYISYNFNTKEEDNYLKQRHPGDLAWNSIGGFKDFAILTDYN